MKPIRILQIEDDIFFSTVTLVAIQKKIGGKLNQYTIQVSTLIAFEEILHREDFNHFILDGRFPESEELPPHLNLSKAYDLIRRIKGSDVFIYVFSGEPQSYLYNHLGDRNVSGLFDKTQILNLLELVIKNEEGS